MTDNEIIKALECHTGKVSKRCQVCPYTIYGCYCLDHLHPDLLDLINRQKAEIERLKGWQDLLKAEKHSLIKAEAVKEFAERLKATTMKCGIEHIEYYDKPPIYKLVPFVDDEDIDNLVKEMAKE